jgi:nucleotide-binding universal stress UspA family protein
MVAGGALLYAELEDHARRMAGKQMADLVEQLRVRGYEWVHANIERGVPHLVILDFAAKNGFDMIVMGTHGRRGFSRFLAGSVAEKVVRLSPAPVLTIRHPDDAGAVSFASPVPAGT